MHTVALNNLGGGLSCFGAIPNGVKSLLLTVFSDNSLTGLQGPYVVLRIKPGTLIFVSALPHNPISVFYLE